MIVAGPFTGPPCPCSTVHRIRLSEHRQSFGGHILSSRSQKTLKVSASNDKRKKNDSRSSSTSSHVGITRRAVMGLLALASPALLGTDAKADVKEPPNESQRMRLEMLQSIEERVRKQSVADTVRVENDIVAPALKEEEAANYPQNDTVAPALKEEETANYPQASTAEVEEKIVSPNTPTKTDEDLRTILSPALTPAVVDATVKTTQTTKTPEKEPFGFLNSLGVLGSGVLGALYWFEGRAKTSSKAALEEVNKKLKKTQAALDTMKESMEKNLMDQQAQSMSQLLESEKDRVAVANELTSLKLEATELQLRLEGQKNVNQNLEKKVKTYQTTIKEANERAKTLEDRLVQEEQKIQGLENEVKGAGILIKEKDEKLELLETELREQTGFGDELRSQLGTTNMALVEAEDRVNELGRELIVARSSLEERHDAMEVLKNSLAAALSRVEEVQGELVSSRKEIAELEESTSGSLENANAAISSKEEEVRDLALKLEAASIESKQAASEVERLQQEMQQLETSLNQEQAAVKQVSEDFKAALDNLHRKTEEVTSLSDDLKLSREENVQLKRQRKDMEVANEARLTTLREALQSEQVMTNQVKNELDETRTAFQASSLEVKSLAEKLKEALSSNKRIQRELDEVRQTASTTMVTLNDEKKKVATAEKQFMETHKALAREEMLVESLRSEFSKAMDAMNDLRKHLGSLSKDLQEANVKIVSLENEKGSLLEVLAKEKKSAQAFKEKAASAESELTKLVREKDGSFYKASKLEDELNVAEAEMHKLKEQMLMMGNVIDSAETRMGSIAQVNTEVTSLLKKFERITHKGEKKRTFMTQIDRLKEQSKAASEISKELRNMKQLLSHFQQNLNEAELDRVEAEAALHAVKRNTNEPVLTESSS